MLELIAGSDLDAEFTMDGEDLLGSRRTGDHDGDSGDILIGL